MISKFILRRFVRSIVLVLFGCYWITFK